MARRTFGFTGLHDPHHQDAPVHGHATPRDCPVAAQDRVFRANWEQAQRERVEAEEAREAENRAFTARLALIMLMGSEAYSPSF